MHIVTFTREEQVFTALFCVIVVVQLVFGDSEAYLCVHYLSKPAIVVSLIIAVLKFSKHIKPTIKYLMSAGLLLSVIGDILLMTVKQWPQAFTLGSMAFLFAHILYSTVFWIQRDTKKSVLPVFIPLFVFGLILFLTIKPGLSALMIPVCMYTLIIIIMACLAYLRIKKIPSLSYWLVFGGALLFVLSDSLLALNTFFAPIPLAHLSIMLTYALAQFGIVFGVLKSKV